MIRNYAGGNLAIPEQWGHAQLIPNGWAGPAIASPAVAGAMVPVGHARQGLAYDHRLTGPYTSAVPDAAIINHGPMVCDIGIVRHEHGHHAHSRRKRTRHSYYKYKHTEKPVVDCIVM